MNPIESNAQVVDEVCEILASVLRVPPGTVRPTSIVRALPNADSVAIIEAVIAIEDHFGIEFPDALVFRIERVLDVAAAVQDSREPDARRLREGDSSPKEGSDAS